MSVDSAGVTSAVRTGQVSPVSYCPGAGAGRARSVDDRRTRVWDHPWHLFLRGRRRSAYGSRAGRRSPSVDGPCGTVRRVPAPRGRPRKDTTDADRRRAARRRPRGVRRARLRRHLDARAGPVARRQPQPAPAAVRLEGAHLVPGGRPRVRHPRRRAGRHHARSARSTTSSACGRWSWASSWPTPPGPRSCASSTRRPRRPARDSTTCSTTTSVRSARPAPSCSVDSTPRARSRRRRPRCCTSS